jgi:hypothetical protein
MHPQHERVNVSEGKSPDIARFACGYSLVRVPHLRRAYSARLRWEAGHTDPRRLESSRPSAVDIYSHKALGGPQAAQLCITYAAASAHHCHLVSGFHPTRHQP